MIALKSILPKGKDGWIVVAGTVFVMLLLSGIALGPVRNKFHAMEGEVSAQEKKLARNLRILAPSARKAVEDEYRQYGLRIQKKGSSDEENSQMLAELDRLAGESKLTLLATKPQKTKVEPDFETYVVEIEVEAEMPALMGFVYGIESSAQILRVDRLVIDSKDGGSAMVKGSLTVSKIVTL
ncbi:MAG: GspMb/PilO family protein [bacterium]